MNDMYIDATGVKLWVLVRYLCSYLTVCPSPCGRWASAPHDFHQHDGRVRKTSPLLMTSAARCRHDFLPSFWSKQARTVVGVSQEERRRIYCISPT